MFESVYKLSSFYNAYGFFPYIVVVVGGGVIHNFLKYVWGQGHPFQEEVYCFRASHSICYGAAPTTGQRLRDNNLVGLGSDEGGEGRGSPHRLNRRLERKCWLDTKDST